MDACLLAGKLWHRRDAVPVQQFSYDLGMVWVDIHEIDALLVRHWGWGRRWRPIVLNDEDFLGTSAGSSLTSKVLARAKSLELDWQTGSIWLLAQPRTLGMIFNPMVMFVHFAPDASQPDSAIAEVHNTPWNQKHWYALHFSQPDDQGFLRYCHNKSFHVSPFLDSDMQYHWALRITPRRFDLRIENRRADERVFSAGLHLQSLSANSRAMGDFMRANALQGLTTRLRIYQQAWHLWRAGAQFYRHPDKAE